MKEYFKYFIKKKSDTIYGQKDTNSAIANKALAPF